MTRNVSEVDVAFGCWWGGAFEKSEQFDRERQHQGGILLCGDLDDRLQEPQLQRCGVLGHDLGCLGQLFGRLKLALGGDDPSTSLTLRLGLAGN